MKQVKKTRSFVPPKSAEVLDAGSFSVIYAHKKFPNAVVKVTGITGARDTNYLVHKLFVNNQTNPWFPKVLFTKVVKASHTEESDEFFSQMIDTNTEDLLNQPYLLIAAIEKLKSAPRETVWSKFKEIGIDFDDLQYVLEEGDNKSISKLIKSCTDVNVIQVLLILKKLFKNKNHNPDFHEGNFMLRGDQLVLIDPAFPEGRN